ncbi:MAG: hypothetical protein ACK504_01835 [Bacteroidota bacterium]
MKNKITFILKSLLIASAISSGVLNAQNIFPTAAGSKVGIGITSPEVALTVHSIENQTILGKNVKSAIKIRNGFATTFGTRSELQFGLSQLLNEQLAVIAAEYTSKGYATGGALLFGTNSIASDVMQERMRIDAIGNIGIGTKNPSAKLDIFGNNGNTTNMILSANYSDKFRWRFKND